MDKADLVARGEACKETGFLVGREVGYLRQDVLYRGLQRHDEVLVVEGRERHHEELAIHAVHHAPVSWEEVVEVDEKR